MADEIQSDNRDVLQARLVTLYPFNRAGLHGKYAFGEGAAECALWLAQSGPSLACDIETAGLGDAAMEVKAVSIGVTDRVAVLDPNDHRQRDAIRHVLSAAGELVFHNSPFDVPILVRNGLMELDDVAKVHDTLIDARFAEPDYRISKSLHGAASRYLGEEIARYKDDLKKSFRDNGLTQIQGWRTYDLRRPNYVLYAGWDVVLTAHLRPAVHADARKRMTDHPFGRFGTPDVEALLEREQRINRIFLRLSARGFRLDFDEIDRWRAELVTAQGQHLGVLKRHGIRDGNRNDLIKFLEAAEAFPTDYPRTEKTQAPSTSADHLKRLDHPVARAYSELFEINKLVRDYAEKPRALAKHDGRIHPEFAILAAKTGRMSASDPPLQQVPGRARKVIAADEGEEWTSIDWGQIEPTYAAYMARDTALLDRLEAPEAPKFYSVVQDLADVSYKQAKVVVLALMYGEGVRKLAGQLSTSVDEAAELRRKVFLAMPGIKRMIYRLQEVATEHGIVPTLSGRVIPVDREFAYKATNYHIQGSAYDLLAEALIRIEDAGLADAVRLAMHDEVVCVTEAAGDIRKIMADPPARMTELVGRTPVLKVDSADLGPYWGEG